jgi:hypothetical protein
MRLVRDHREGLGDGGHPNQVARLPPILRRTCRRGRNEPRVDLKPLQAEGAGPLVVGALILMGDWCGEENYRHHPREIPAKVKSRH